jgi:hypothetical protein
MYDIAGKLWLLHPKGNARVAVISSPHDLQHIIESYPVQGPGLIDWEGLSMDYDAVWFPDPQQWRHTEGRAGTFFHMVDVESSLWFRWCFNGSVKQLAKPSRSS